jgi:hypothetical protein
LLHAHVLCVAIVPSMNQTRQLVDPQGADGTKTTRGAQIWPAGQGKLVSLWAWGRGHTAGKGV